MSQQEELDARTEILRLGDALEDSNAVKERHRLGIIRHLETIEHLRHQIDIMESLCSAYEIANHKLGAEMQTAIRKSRRDPE